MKYRARHILEYAALRALALSVALLPHRLSLITAWMLAGIAFHLLHWRRAEAERRIREVFGDRFSEPEIRRIAWRSLRNICFNAIELIKGTNLSTEWMRKYCPGTDENIARLKGHAEQAGRGIVVSVAHMGNWDLAGLVAERWGLPLQVVMRSQRNPLVNAYLERKRGAGGGVVMDRDDPGLLKKIIGYLAEGRTLAILIDLRSPAPALLLPFLGGTANVGRGLATTTRQGKTVVVPMTHARRGWTIHDWKVHEPIIPDASLPKKEQDAEVIRQALQVITDAVFEDPAQYFWYNKRWVLDPPPEG